MDGFVDEGVVWIQKAAEITGNQQKKSHENKPVIVQNKHE